LNLSYQLKHKPNASFVLKIAITFNFMLFSGCAKGTQKFTKQKQIKVFFMSGRGFQDIFKSFF